MKQFLKNRIDEELNCILLENIIHEDYPTTWDVEEFKKLGSFAARKKYCENNLQRISSGSSRIVYKIDNEKVLKLAKNEKGLGQNASEAQWKDDRYYEDILARIFNYHQKDYWLEMELALRVKNSDFIKILGISLDDIGRYLENFELENKGRRPFYIIDEKIIEKLNESDFVNRLMGYTMDADCLASDLSKLSSYGLVYRDGNPTIVVVDYGLTSSTWADYYK